MTVFTRGSDAARYIQLLSQMVSSMGEDISRMAKIFGVDISTDDIIKSYTKSAEGPTILESILIEDGKMTQEEATMNWVMNSLFLDLKTRSAAIDRIVKCNECKNAKGESDIGIIWCNKFSNVMSSFGFCSCGERRNDHA